MQYQTTENTADVLIPDAADRMGILAPSILPNSFHARNGRGHTIARVSSCPMRAVLELQLLTIPRRRVTSNCSERFVGRYQRNNRIMPLGLILEEIKSGL